MKVIINAAPDEIEAVAALIMRTRSQFARHPERLGWGWHFSIPNGRAFFLRHIKGGISANPVKETTHDR